jgi:hypothetical protein
MIATRRPIAFLVAAACGLGLAACSGGATTPPVKVAAAPTAAPSPQSVAKASATITIKLSHIKEHLASVKKKGAGTTKRGPRFVDPNGTYLEIMSYGEYSNNTLGTNMATFPAGVTFVPINDANTTFTATVPIISDPLGTTNVYVLEVDDGGPYTAFSPPSAIDVVSYGEGYITAPSPGSSNSLTVTLEMNPAALGVAYPPDYSETATSLYNSSSDSPTDFSIEPFASNTTDGDAYAYFVAGDVADDVDDCYFAVPGTGPAGNMPQISFTQTSDDGGYSYIAQAQNGAYVYFPDIWFDGVTANVQTSIAAWPTDGPFTSSPILPANTVNGYVDFQCTGDCGGG